MAGTLLPFVTLKDYRHLRGWKRFHRWKAVTHNRASDEQHQGWMAEQAEEIQREEDYRVRVGTTERMGRVLGLDGSESPQLVRTIVPLPERTPEALPVQVPQAAVLVDD